MNYITEEILEGVVENLDSLDEEKLNELVQAYFGRQPFLMMYLMAFNEELEDEDMQNEMIYLTLVALESFYSLGKEIALISEEEITAEEEKQIDLMTKFELITDDDERMEAAAGLMSSEEVLLEFIGESLDENIDEDDEDDEDSEEELENIGMIFGIVKLVTDLLNSSLSKGGLKIV
jgi:hypothetical protein